MYVHWQQASGPLILTGGRIGPRDGRVWVDETTWRAAGKYAEGEA
jgi:hypothetical protein